LLLSMTGFGEARLQDPRWTILVEVRTVNNRHFKLNAKISDTYATMESALEQLVREKVKRGTVQLSVKIERPRRPEDYRLNLVALGSYRDQLKGFQGSDQRTIDVSQLLLLPGVVEQINTESRSTDQDWPAIAEVIVRALADLESSRDREGRAMAAELIALAGAVSDQLSRIAERGPQLVPAFQKKLTDRIQALVQEQGVTIESKDLAREVAILADRSDISEEVVRLRAHLKQYSQIIEEPVSSGRKLEFVVQEMGREINTIGSKANDIEISRFVVEIKALLEKVRELIQNVE
jgi:uncharacterized protein (TIGR00255 family)